MQCHRFQKNKNKNEGKKLRRFFSVRCFSSSISISIKYSMIIKDCTENYVGFVKMEIFIAFSFFFPLYVSSNNNEQNAKRRPNKENQKNKSITKFIHSWDRS